MLLHINSIIRWLLACYIATISNSVFADSSQMSLILNMFVNAASCNSAIISDANQTVDFGRQLVDQLIISPPTKSTLLQIDCTQGGINPYSLKLTINYLLAETSDINNRILASSNSNIGYHLKWADDNIISSSKDIINNEQVNFKETSNKSVNQTKIDITPVILDKTKNISLGPADATANVTVSYE